jgi:hypothetical protein
MFLLPKEKAIWAANNSGSKETVDWNEQKHVVLIIHCVDFTIAESIALILP